jgi:hypothetical protein
LNSIPRSLPILLACCFAVVALSCGGGKKASGSSTPSAPAEGGSGNLTIAGLEIGRSFGSDKHVTERLDVLKTGETPCFAVITDGAGENQALSLIATNPAGVLIFQEKRTISSPGGRIVATTFEIPPQPTDLGRRYAVRATIGSSSLVQEFAVR